MKDIEFIPFLLTEKADIFSIRLDGNEKTETEEFLIEFKDTQSIQLRNDLNSILTSINQWHWQRRRTRVIFPPGREILR